MRAYVREIPGVKKEHEKIEDSHYVSPGLEDLATGVDGFCMVADGCSGYKGTTASHLAVKVIRDYLKSNLTSNRNHVELIKEAIIKANEKIHRKTAAWTTLDLLLISEEELNVAHLGDSRTYFVYDNEVVQVTEDEEKGGIPTNFVGQKSIGDVSINDRINIYQYKLKEGERKPKYILLATDGLWENVDEGEIKKDLLSLSKYDDPASLLDKWAKQIYRHREHDDATMVLVDLDNGVANSLSELKTLDEQGVPELNAEKERLEGELATKTSRVEELEKSLPDLEEALSEARQGAAYLAERAEEAENEVKELRKQIATEEPDKEGIFGFARRIWKEFNEDD